MKKMVCGMLALVCAGGSLFAEVVLSGSGRILWAPFGAQLPNDDSAKWGDGKDYPVRTYFGAENPWWNDGPRIGLNLNGQREEGNMGFKLGFRVENGAPVIDDCIANVWLRPFYNAEDEGNAVLGSITLTFGQYAIDNMRYKFAGSGIGFHNYVQYIRAGDSGAGLTNEESTFQRFQSPGFGTHISIEPVSGLWLGAGFGSVGSSRLFRNEWHENGWVDAMKNAQIAAGYTIEGVGLVRVQWVGWQEKYWRVTEADPSGNPTKWGWVVESLDKPLNYTGDAGKIQAAFNLTAVKGFNADLGVSFALADEKDWWDDLDKTNKTKTVTTQPNHTVSLGFDVNTRPVRVYGIASGKFGGYTEEKPAVGDSTTVKQGTELSLNIEPWWYINSGLMLVAELFVDTRFGSDEEVTGSTGQRGADADPSRNPDAGAKNNYTDLGFGLFVRKNIPGGDIRAGVACKVPGVAGDAHKGAALQITVPVMFNYGF
ncbi:MAG: hypothetical protein LBC72_03530 [Spirochaetaceae bacterium]|jgi:hypothetical protein|nr:hypothetical protein [Spirochaetaceae bacterium]